MDISMPDMNGLMATENILKRQPESKIIALTMHDSADYVAELIRLGAKGYVLKDTDPNELIKAIIAVNSGGQYFSPKINNTLLNDYTRKIRKSKRSFIDQRLTPRERDVLVKIVTGMTNKEIAKSLSISVRTVETHREHIQQKLNIKNVAKLTQYALSRGLIEVKSQ
jgi:DNA-binding NarL/FixJ family response regulator